MIKISLKNLHLPMWGWHREDMQETSKLTASLRKHGQLSAIVVREVDGSYEIVDGRRRLAVMQSLGWEQAWVLNKGPLTKLGAVRVAMSLELAAEVDYAELAWLIKELAVEPDFPSLANTTPFSADRLGYFVRLAGFNWDQYNEATKQAQLFEDEEPSEEELLPEVVFAGVPKQTVAPKVVPASTRPRGIPEMEQVFMRTIEPTRPTSPPEPPTVGTSYFVATSTVPPEPPTVGISYFSDAPIVQQPTSKWVAQEPPCLDGISNIVLNFETNGLKWRLGDRPIGVTVGTMDGLLKRYLPFGHKGGGNLDEATVKRWAQRELRNKHITNANTKFEVHMSREWGVDLEEQGNTVSDVQHYAALLNDNRRKFALDVLAQDYLGGIQIPRIDESNMAEYHAADVALRAEYQAELVVKLRDVMWPIMDAEELQPVRQLEDDLIFPVCHMERNGAPIDAPLLRQWVSESERELNRILVSVAKAVGFMVNPDSSEDWTKLFEALHIPITVFTPKITKEDGTVSGGAPSFADEVLRNIQDPVVQMARRAGRIASIRSKFLLAYDKAVDNNGLLSYNLHQLRSDDYGTISGRFSCTDKNIQQVMRLSSQREAFGYSGNDGSHDDEIYMIRRLFLPGSGVWLCADARQIEYRLFAHYAGNSKVLAAYAADPLLSYHKLVHASLLPFKPDVIYDKAKTLNFCLLYGGGKDKVAELLDMPRQESDEFVGIYHRMYPEVSILLRKAAKLAEDRGYVRTLYGRRARFPDKKFTHSALNRVIQGTAADDMKLKIVELHRERKSTGFLMRFPVHDEINGDAPDQECVDKVQKILDRQSLETKVPLLWEVGCGPNWAKAKS